MVTISLETTNKNIVECKLFKGLQHLFNISTAINIDLSISNHMRIFVLYILTSVWVVHKERKATKFSKRHVFAFSPNCWFRDFSHLLVSKNMFFTSENMFFWEYNPLPAFGCKLKNVFLLNFVSILLLFLPFSAFLLKKH